MREGSERPSVVRSALARLVAASLFVCGACSSTGATLSPRAASQAPGQPARVPARGCFRSAPVAGGGDLAPIPRPATTDARGRRRDVPGPALTRRGFETFNGAHSNIQIDYQCERLRRGGIKAITEQTRRLPARPTRR